MDVTSSDVISLCMYTMIGYSMHRRLGDVPSIHPSIAMGTRGVVASWSRES